MPPDSEPHPDYYPTGSGIVFTESYHLRRGYCCQSEPRCRHCPYPAPPDPPLKEDDYPYFPDADGIFRPISYPSPPD